MRIAIYVRVSTQRQAQTQTIDQQLDRLRRVADDRRWPLPADHVFRDDGYSGASLRRPGLDRLRDLAALAKLDRILITDPEHATPVELVRNGLRSIAVGSGATNELLLPYLAVNSDVKPGDLLVTSGLGGVFPAGYPVAVVTGIKRE